MLESKWLDQDGLSQHATGKQGVSWHGPPLYVSALTASRVDHGCPTRCRPARSSATGWPQDGPKPNA
eukprot:1034842-Pyramimonas_sp.AAC.1